MPITDMCGLPYMVLYSLPYIDLVWSDPEEVDGWAISPRGAGYLFGAKVTHEVSSNQDSITSAHIVSCVVLIAWRRSL